MRPETVPLLVVALLLVSAQPGVESVTTVVAGSQEVETGSEAVIVADGTATVPEGRTVETALYVIGGTAEVEGTVEGRVVQLAGEVRVGPDARVTGVYRVLGGSRSVAPGAAVPVDVVAEPLTQRRSPAEAAGLFALQALGLAALGFLAGRRLSGLLDNVAHSTRHHPAVSATVGVLTTVTLLSVLVFMAFTLVLIPVTLFGLFVGALVFLYAYVAVGYLVGRRLVPGRPGLATAAGTVLFLVASELLGFVPVVGGLVPLLVLVTAVGASFVTYFGLRRFEPPQLAAVE